MKQQTSNVGRAITLLLALALASFCGAQRGAHEQPPVSPMSALPFGTFGPPANQQGGGPQTNFAGIIDPTNSAYGGGLICHPANDGPAAAIAIQNRAAVTSAFAYAAANNLGVFIPSCAGYPMARASSHTYSVDLSGDSNLTVWAYNATFRQYGDATSSAFNMFELHNASHIRIYGALFSQRDVTNSTVDTVAIKIGDGGSTSVDDVGIFDAAFVEGVGGDYVRMDGGSSAQTVSRVSITRATRFDNAAHAAIDIRPGVRDVSITYDFFRNNADRDILCEAAVDNVIGRLIIEGNTMERSSSTAAAAITVSGNGGANGNEQTMVVHNDITDGVIEGVNLRYAHISDNDIRYAVAHGGTAMIDLSGALDSIWVERNNIDRHTGASSGAGISLVATGTAPAIGPVWVKKNRVRQYSGVSPGIEVTGNTWAIVDDNAITYHNSTTDSGSGFVGILCSSSSTPCAGIFTKNRIDRNDQEIKASLDLGSVTTHANAVIEAVSPGVYGNSITIKLLGDASGAGGSRTVSGTAITYHFKPALSTEANLETLINADPMVEIKTPGTPSNTLQSGDALSPTALAGGLQAGRIQAGIKIVDSGSTTVGLITLRDNVIDGATTGYVIGSSSTTYPDGPPLVSGQFSISNTAEMNSGLATTGWVLERTPDAETISSGAASVTKHATFFTTANTVGYTQADGIRDGDVHFYKIKSVSGTPIGTLTFAGSPPHFADGTLHTISWVAAGGSFELIWDGTSGTYRLGPGATGVTIN